MVKRKTKENQIKRNFEKLKKLQSGVFFFGVGGERVKV